MSHLALTASFGSATRYHPGPKHVRVFGQLLTGGSSLYLFTNLERPGQTFRLRASESSVADALMAGLAIAEPALALEGPADTLADRFRAGVAPDAEIGAEDASLLAAAVANVDVALLLTVNEFGPSIKAEDFRGWSVSLARSAS